MEPGADRAGSANCSRPNCTLGARKAAQCTNVVVVGLANKMARIAWVILSKGIRYHASELVVA